MSTKPDTEVSLRRTTSTSSSDLTTKMVRNYVASPNERNRNTSNDQLNIADMLGASDTVTTQIRTYEILKQILPDIEIIESIVTTGILKPKDNQDPKFTYNGSDSILGNEVVTVLNAIMKSHFTEALKLENKLEEIIQKVLFRQGSYPIMILPEGTVESALKTYSTNYSAEHYKSQMAYYSSQIEAILGRGITNSEEKVLTTESYKDDKYLITNDKASSSGLLSMGLILSRNIDILKIPTLASQMASDKLKVSYESQNSSKTASSNTIRRIELVRSKLSARRVNEIVPTLDITKMKDQAVKSEGHPIVLHLPAESVIPILSPSGDLVISYLVILDNRCNPIRNDINTDQYTEISRNMRSDNSQFNQVSNRLKTLGFVEQDVTEIKQNNLKRFWDAYAQKFEENIRKEIEDGLAAGSVQFKADAATYQLMFFRLLQGMQTRILNVPPDMITYIAFDKNEYGIGKSLIEKNKITGFIRANLHLAGAVGALQNSINHTQIDITLDKKDTNAKRTVATLVNNVMSLNTNSIPALMASSPTELLQYVSKSGYSVNVQGENTSYPQTACSVSDKGRNVVRPDTDYLDTLRRMFISGLWTTPETVDAALQGDLATPMIINNAINTNRYATANTKLCAFITQHVIQYTVNSSILMEALSNAIKDHLDKIPEKYNEFLGNETPRDIERTEDPQREDMTKKINDILEVYLATLEVTLPKPNTNSIQTQAEAINNIIANVNAIMDVMFNEDTMYGLGKDKLSEEIKLLKSTLVIREISRWSKETGYLQDIFNLDIVSSDDDSLSAIISGLSSTPNAIVKVASMLGKVVQEAQTEIKPDVDAMISSKGELTGDGGEGEGEYSSGDDTTGDDIDDGSGEVSGGEEVPELPDGGEDASETEGEDTEDTDTSEDTSDEENTPELPDVEDTDTIEGEDEEEPAELPESDNSTDKKGDDSNSDEPPELPSDKK